MRKLFVEELKKVEGGSGSGIIIRRCPPTTQACCEEAPPCQSCSDVS